MGRGLWFLAGAGAGAYALLKVRRTAEALTADGLRDRASALSLGAHLFRDEVRTGMLEKEDELRQRLGLAVDGARLRELAGPGNALTQPPAPGLTTAPELMEGRH